MNPTDFSSVHKDITQRAFRLSTMSKEELENEIQWLLETVEEFQSVYFSAVTQFDLMPPASISKILLDSREFITTLILYTEQLEPIVRQLYAEEAIARPLPTGKSKWTIDDTKSYVQSKMSAVDAVEQFLDNRRQDIKDRLFAQGRRN